MDEIIMQPGTCVARSDHYFSAIARVRSDIFKACGKCDNGFITDKHARGKNAVEDYEVECECRPRAELASTFIASGLPGNYNIKSHLNFDNRAKEQIDNYIAKIAKAFDKGIGILLCADEGLEKYESTLAYARVLAAHKILSSAIVKGFTGHFIDANAYCELKRKTSIKDENERAFIREIEDVDFLCLSRICAVARMEYVQNQIASTVITRINNRKPVILISNVTDKKLYSIYGSDVSSYFMNNMACIKIHNFIGATNDYINLKKDL